MEDVPEPSGRRRGRPPGGAKRRRLDDDEAEEAVESDQGEPELPGGELPPLGSSKGWDLVVCDEAHRPGRHEKGACRCMCVDVDVKMYV